MIYRGLLLGVPALLGVGSDGVELQLWDSVGRRWLLAFVAAQGLRAASPLVLSGDPPAFVVVGGDVIMVEGL